MKTVSIETEGIEQHINRYFEAKNLPHRFKDVVYLKDLRIGGKPISMQRQMKELGMNAKQTLYGWHKRIDDQV
jgi:hypothetical protein